MGEWHPWGQEQGDSGLDPRDDYIRDFDGKMRSRYEIEKRKQEHITAITEAAIQRQLHPEIARQERQQAIKANPLLAHAAENMKVPRSEGGKGKCYLCNHPHRAEIEAEYRRLEGWKHGNGVKAYRAAVAAQYKGSRIAYLNHMDRHLTPPVPAEEGK